MLVPDIVRSSADLVQILQLQRDNHKDQLSIQEKSEQGFVTLQHTLPILEAMHALAPSIVIRDNEKIVAYALTELPACRHLMPALEPMFALLDTQQWNDKPISAYPFYTMGQVCISKAYRGQGLFDQLYLHHKKIFSPTYELFITEISSSNTRSIRAHQRIGFQTLLTHQDELDEWLLVVWDWR